MLKIYLLKWAAIGFYFGCIIAFSNVGANYVSVSIIQLISMFTSTTIGTVIFVVSSYLPDCKITGFLNRAVVKYYSSIFMFVGAWIILLSFLPLSIGEQLEAIIVIFVSMGCWFGYSIGRYILNAWWDYAI